MYLILKELKAQGVTILLASHNERDMEVLCDEIYEMEMGTLTKVRKEE